MQLLFYTPKISPRLHYIVSTLFNAVGLDNAQITDDFSYFIKFEGAKINYAPAASTNDELWLSPAELLFEDEITKQKIDCFQWKGLKAFYKTEGFIPFDIFAASFYLITRYEEYLPHQLDEYGRYAHKNSIAFNEGFLHLPLINLWMKELKEALHQKFPGLTFHERSFQFIPTYDIDIAWSYLHKGLIRNIGGTFKSILKGGWPLVKERLAVLQKRKKDPFDVFDWLDNLHEKCKLNPYYFFLLAKENKGYDKNIRPNNFYYKKLIKEHKEQYNVGIHPSWQSSDEDVLLENEIATLYNITGEVVKNSRQHYIRMRLPETYRKLINAGIENDFSMGYGSINGFRASYCLPYYWYDLEKGEMTNLLIYPFCYMEANSYYEQHYSLQQAKEELYQYYQITKEVNGQLITIWHNHIMGNKQLFDGWKEMYEEFCLNHDLEGL